MIDGSWSKSRHLDNVFRTHEFASVTKAKLISIFLKLRTVCFIFYFLSRLTQEVFIRLRVKKSISSCQYDLLVEKLMCHRDNGSILFFKQRQHAFNGAQSSLKTFAVANDPTQSSNYTQHSQQGIFLIHLLQSLYYNKWFCYCFLRIESISRALN